MTKRLFGIVLMMMLMTTLSLKVYAGPVTVKGGIANGTVAVDKATADPGETVTITVTPANGFYAEKSDVKAEKTIDGGSAQAPGLKANPGVGSFVDIQGDAPADISGVATYTFTMPEAPYGVQVSAEFHECTTITEAMFNSIAEQEFTGQQITPAVQCADGNNLVLGTDYTVEYGENVGPGMNAGTVTITGKNKYTGTALLYFTIFRETYEIRWGQGSPWDSQHVIAMTKGTDGKWVAADQEMAATSEFKVVKKREAGETTDTWYGAPGNDNYWINAGTLNTEIQLYEGNQNLYFPNSGTYTFTFDPATNKLVVSGEIIYNVTVADGIQNGTVVASQTSGKAGDPITITATANPGYELETLTYTAEGGEPVPIENNQFAMPAANVTINATFKKVDYTITVTSNEYGKVTVKDKELVENKTTATFEESITLNIAANEDCVLDKLMVDGVDVTTQVDNNTYTFTMPSHNVAVEATFRALTITYEIHWGITPEGATSWAEDHVIPMTKRDDGGWVAINQAMPDRSEFKVVKKSQDGDNEPVLTWYGAQADGMYWITADNLGFEIQLGSEQGYNNLYFPEGGNFTFNFNPTNNRLAVTGSVMYDITYSVGPGGTVTADKTQAVCQEIVTVTVTPNPGYEIDELKYTFEVRLPDGTPTGSHATYPIENGQFSMPASDVTIIATFKLKDYTITLLGGQPSHATVTVPATAHFGDEVTVTVEPELGYEVEEMRYDYIAAPEGTGGQGVHVNSPIENGKFTMPAADVTLSVTIKKIDYTITVAQTQNGTVTAPETANYGDEVTLTVTPAEGYELETLTYTVEGGEPVPVENNKFNMPAANVTINATFKEVVVEYYYSVVEEVNCLVTDNGNGRAPEGATVSMRIVVDSGNKLKEVIVNKVTGEGAEQVVTPIEFTTTPVEGSNDVDLTFVMPAADVQVHAICATAYSVNVVAGEHGNAAANMAEAYHGETVTVTTNPDVEYKVNEIYYVIEGSEEHVNLTAVEGENGKYTFSMPAAPVTVFVTFKTIIDYYKVKFDAAPTGGTVSVMANGETIQSMDDVAEFVMIDVTVTPAEGYEVENFKVCEGLDEPEGSEVTYDIVDGVYKFGMPRNDVTIFVTFKQTQYELEGVTFTADRQWATYYNGTKNLALPQGVKAYVVNGVVNDAVDITEIDYIPAGVGVLLYSDNAADQVMTTAYTGETSSYTSLLVGSDEAQSITAGYVLYNNNFIRSEAGTVAAHRCYLPATQVAGAPRLLKIGLGDVPTAIESIIAQGNVAGIKYVNINGMTSNEPFRGINIAVITFTDGTTRTVKVVK
jgi:hypothetical protein